MRYALIPYAWVLFASALVSLVLSAVAWPRREVSGVKQYIAMMAMSLIWSLSNAFEMMGLDLSTKLFWANVQYIYYSAFPIVSLWLALEYTGKTNWLTRRRALALLVIPVVTVILAWTNHWHGLIRRDVFLDTSGSFPVIAKEYGIWFCVHAIYSYVVMGAAVAVHSIAVRTMLRLYRPQALTLLVGFTMPLCASLAYTLGLSPLAYDISPVVFSVGGVLLAVGILRFGLFDLVPAGYSLVIDSMGDGMVILDERSRIVDLNPVAERLIGARDVIGRPISSTLG